MGPVRRLLAVLVGVVALGSAAAPALAATPSPVPPDFFGVVVDGPMLDERAPVEQEVAHMRRAGLSTIRLPIHWAEVAPWMAWEVVPPDERGNFIDLGGMPADVRKLDRWALAAARNGMTLLPAVLRTPWYAAVRPGEEGSPVRNLDLWERFLDGLVRRYGPQGTLWAEHADVPRRPIRDWQIWNEPNLTPFFTGNPWPATFVDMLRVAHGAVKRADPGARVVLAGLANDNWVALKYLYAAGAKPYFDVAAVHPYSRDIRGVVELVRRFRRTMQRNGDGRKPLMVTEMGWVSAKGSSRENLSWETTEAGQAIKLAAGVTALSRRRQRLGIETITWYSWLSPPSGDTKAFSYAGLRKQSAGGNVDKPAYRALVRTIRQLVTRG